METSLAHAKINLSLRIVGRSGEYHMLDMVTASLALADRITLCGIGETSSLEYSAGEADIPNRTDNCMAAVRGMAELTGERGFRIRIEKNIPSCAGLGGSSAEAAGVIRLIAATYGIRTDDSRIARLALNIGSDVPLLLENGYCRVKGRGEHVSRIPCTRSYGILLACNGAVSTACAFRLSDEMKREDGDNEALMASIDCVRAEMLVNDLMPAAMQLEPRIGDVLKSLRRAGAIGVNMTGSGACCYAIFDTEEQARAAEKTVLADYIKVTKTIID